MAISLELLVHAVTQSLPRSGAAACPTQPPPVRIQLNFEYTTGKEPSESYLQRALTSEHFWWLASALLITCYRVRRLN